MGYIQRIKSAYQKFDLDLTEAYLDGARVKDLSLSFNDYVVRRNALATGFDAMRMDPYAETMPVRQFERRYQDNEDDLLAIDGVGKRIAFEKQDILEKPRSRLQRFAFRLGKSIGDVLIN